MDIIQPTDPRINAEMAAHFDDARQFRSWYQTEFGDPFVLDTYFGKHAGRLIDPSATVLDIGSGVGILGAMLRKNGHTGKIIACDVSRPMLDYVAASDHYTCGYHCDAIRALEEMATVGQPVDWAVSVLTMAAFPPVQYSELMERLYRTCRTGMIHSLETLASEKQLVRGVPEYSRTFDEALGPAKGLWAADVLEGRRDYAMLLHLKPIAA